MRVRAEAVVRRCVKVKSHRGGGRTLPYSVHCRCAVADPKADSTWSYEIETTFARALLPQSSANVCDQTAMHCSRQRWDVSITVARGVLRELGRVPALERTVVRVERVEKQVVLQVGETGPACWG